MTYVSFIEKLRDEIVDFVWSNLPGVLQDYETLSEDDIKLPMFKEKLVGDYLIDNITMFPGLILKPGSINLNPDNEQRPFSKDLVIFEGSFWASMKGSNVGTMQKQMDRYAWAIKTILDSQLFTPTQPTLVDAIRNATMIDYHEGMKVELFTISTVFVDFRIKTYADRVG